VNQTGLPVAMMKSLTATIEKSAGTSGTFVLTSSDLDRDDDRIAKEAIAKAARDKQKLLCLWQHKRDQPIGSWENLRMQGNKLLGDLRLAATNLGLMVKQLLDEDVPLAASIGFMGTGQFNDMGGIDYREIELLECSVVSVPANAQATRIAKSFGFDLKSFEEEAALPASGLSDAAQAALQKARRSIANANLEMRKK
jgi:HK97 family phage prohead protease